MKNENVLEYKGCIADVWYDKKDKKYCGMVTNTQDLIRFHTKEKSEIEQKIHESVDDYYINFCDGKYPEDDFSFTENKNTSLINSTHGGIKVR